MKYQVCWPNDGGLHCEFFRTAREAAEYAQGRVNADPMVLPDLSLFIDDDQGVQVAVFDGVQLEWWVKGVLAGCAEQQSAPTLFDLIFAAAQPDGVPLGSLKRCYIARLMARDQVERQQVAENIQKRIADDPTSPVDDDQNFLAYLDQRIAEYRSTPGRGLFE